MRFAWICVFLFQSLLVANSSARPVTDTTTVDKDESFVLVKLSGDDFGKFATFSLVTWEEEKINTSIAEYFSIPADGDYALIKQSISGNFYPYDMESNKRLAQGRKMLIGKKLRGSLVLDGEMQYTYTLQKRTINYLGDIVATKADKKHYSLEVTNEIEQATAFLEANFPRLLKKYGVTASLMESAD